MDERKGILFAAVTALVSGASIFINKAGVAEFDPFLFTALKNALVAVLLLSIVLLFSEWKALKRLDARQWKYLAAIGVVGGSIPFLLFFWGLSLTSAVNASFIHKTMFLFIGVLAAVFLREKMEKKHLAAAIALLAGNALLIGLPGSLDYGALLVLAATVFWAVETIISKRALSALEIPPRIVALARMGFGSLVLAAFLFATGRMELLAGLRPEHFAWIGVASVFLLAYVASWYTALKHARATTAAMVLVLGAPVTTLLSFTVLAQAVTPLQVAGMLLLAAGVAAGTGAFSLLAAPFARFVAGRGAAKARAGDRK